MIVYTIIQLLLTIAGGLVIAYGVYLTMQVSGDNLLTMDSTLGYKYATTYHKWQLFALIAIVIMIVIWIIYLCVLRKYLKKRKAIKKELKEQQINTENQQMMQDTSQQASGFYYAGNTGYPQNTYGYGGNTGYPQNTYGYGGNTGYPQNTYGYGGNTGYPQNANGYEENTENS